MNEELTDLCLKDENEQPVRAEDIVEIIEGYADDPTPDDMGRYFIERQACINKVNNVIIKLDAVCKIIYLFCLIKQKCIVYVAVSVIQLRVWCFTNCFSVHLRNCELGWS